MIGVAVYNGDVRPRELVAAWGTRLPQAYGSWQLLSRAVCEFADGTTTSVEAMSPPFRSASEAPMRFPRVECPPGGRVVRVASEVISLDSAND